MAIDWLTFESKKLKGFPMKDAHARTFPVYLPPGYSKKPKVPYNVFFLLAGYSGKGSAYIADDSAFGVPLQARLDRAILDKKLPPCIVVFPDCTSKYGCSQYVNSPAFGHYMDYLCDELVPLIDEKYPTRRSRDHRAVAGHSSGGFGALVTGMLRPDAFGIVCSSAGDSFYEANVISQINTMMIELQKAGGIEKFIKGFLEADNRRSLSSGAFDCMMMLQLASCYAPNPKAPPLYGDLFFDLETGALIPEVWEKYLSWDPVRMVDRQAANLRKLKWILLEAGLQDEHALQWGHRQIAQKLKGLGVPHEVVEYPGGHGGHHWRFESRLIRMSQRMG
jgi:enterochelin esterase-like enzyme